jgi:hypothetical protein
MKPKVDATDLITSLPTPGLPETLRQRTLVLARAHLAPSPETAPLPLRYALPVHATSAALLSADAAFLVSTCLNITRAFGG